MVLEEDAAGLAGTGERERRRGLSISNFAVGDPRWRLCVATFEWAYMAGCELRGETSVGTGILAITAGWYSEGEEGVANKKKQQWKLNDYWGTRECGKGTL